MGRGCETIAWVGEDQMIDCDTEVVGDWAMCRLVRRSDKKGRRRKSDLPEIEPLFILVPETG